MFLAKFNYDTEILYRDSREVLSHQRWSRIERPSALTQEHAFDILSGIALVDTGLMKREALRRSSRHLWSFLKAEFKIKDY